MSSLAPRRIKGKNPESEGKVRVDLTIQILDLILRWCLSGNSSVDFKKLRDAKTLFDLMDITGYGAPADRDLLVRIHVIRTVLDCVVVSKITEIDLVKPKMREGKYGQEGIEIFIEAHERAEVDDLSNAQTKYVEEFLRDRLNYAFMFPASIALGKKIEEMRSGDFESLQTLTKEFSQLTADITRKTMNVSLMNVHSSMDFSTHSDSLSGAFATSITELKKPSNIIRTGIRKLNDMLNGGFQASRTYLFMGETGGWKSGFLLSCVKWAIEHNPDVRCNDPSTRPCVLYVTMENDMHETNERIWSMIKVEGDPDELKKVNPDVAMARFRASGWVIEEETELTKMCAFIRYRPSRSISTADIDAMIDDLALEGFEVRMVVQDYVKRILPVEKMGDLRLDLGNVMDEFSTVAKIRGIPVVTAAQLNRDGTKLIEAAISANKANVGKKMGLSAIGESKLMIDNADYVFFNYIEQRQSTETMYLTMNRLKTRGRMSSLEKFLAHPFVQGNMMLLEEDVNLACSLSLTDLGQGLNQYDPTVPRRRLRNPNPDEETESVLDRVDEAVAEFSDFPDAN